MNNSLAIERVKLSLEEPSLNLEPLRESEAKIVRIIEAIVKLEKSEEWSTLKSLIFDEALESLEKRLKLESKSAKLDDSKIYRLQGELSWAEKYADLHKLAQVYRQELTNIRKLTQPTKR